MKKQINNADQHKIDLQALKESDERFRNIVLRSPDAIIVTGANGKIEYMNPAAEKVFNRKLESFIGNDFGLTLVNGESTEIDIVRPGKDPGIGDMYVVEIEWLGEKAYLITIRDITDHKRAEAALRDSKDHLHTLLQTIPDLIWLKDKDGVYLSCNTMFERFFGAREADIVGKTDYDFVDRELADSFLEHDRKAMAAWKPTSNEEWITFADDGHRAFLETIKTPMHDSEGTLIGVLGIGRNITKRKRAEEELQKSESLLQKIFDLLPVGLWFTDKDGKLMRGNPAGVKIWGAEPKVDPAEYGVFKARRLPSGEEIAPEDWALVHTVREGVTIVDEMLEIDAFDGKKKVVLNYTAPVLNDQGAIQGAIVVNLDITSLKEAEKQLQDTVESLRKSVGATIQVMVSAVEMRDPYTAGHQLRVAKIACAIATEMGFSQEKIEGIRMAGSIHDIGKLSIPAEILVKPTKLTNTEFSLIKEHSQTGYEMLKDVESPWPLAQIVYQHHERMDGSGYPNKLKGDEILLEARIMAVADVVEAMASHRPYRAALGIEIALEEIEKNKGTSYDNTVADACLKLFREKGFQLVGNKY